MKKLMALLFTLGFFAFSMSTVVVAQDGEQDTSTQEVMDDTTENMEDTTAMEAEESDAEEAEEAAIDASASKDDAPEEEKTGHQKVMKWYIDGDPDFMIYPLLCLILGLGFAIERIISLNLATVNTKKLLSEVEVAVQSGNIDQAKEICKSTRGPVASIFYQGLERIDEGVEIVEKAIVSYGSVQMGQLEKGLVWISLFIALAPMLGFMGTVIGMIEAFNAIEKEGDINPSLVASGIKLALITTLFGLIVAIILQVFYNYIVSKIDGMVNTMEEASITFVDILIRNNVTKTNNPNS